MKQKWFLRCFQMLTCVLFALSSYSVYGSEDMPFAPGSQLPQFTLPASNSQQASTYLGIKTAEPCALSSVGSKLVLIEFMSAMCPHCHTNAPILNRLYKVIQEDAALAKDVKIIGIAIGNDQTQAEAFRKNFKVPFPIFPDESMAIAGTVEVMTTPTMILVTKSGKVLTSHSGVIQDFDGFLKELREINKKQ